MVPGEHDYCSVGDTSRLQLLQQIGHGPFQLQLASQVGQQGLGTLQSLHQVSVLLADGVDVKTVVGVAGVSHIVGVERLQVEVGLPGSMSKPKPRARKV